MQLQVRAQPVERKVIPFPIERRLAPFREPTLVRSSTETQRGHTMRIEAYGERASTDGRTDQIPFELTMCKAIGRVLTAEYPGHPWMVEVMAEQGIAKITIPPLLGTNWGYILHLDQDLSPKVIINAGGHILERFRIPRSTIDLAAYMAAEGNIPLIGRFRASHGNRIPT